MQPANACLRKKYEMKILIVFFAIVILNVTFLCYNTDMDRYVKLQAHLKALAEESAAGAALFVDEKLYSQGILAVDKAAADAYIDFMVKKAEEDAVVYRGGSITASTILMDDIRGYEQAEYYKIYRRCPAVIVTLLYLGQDLFRLPFACVERVERTATYQWEDGLTSRF